MYQLGAVIQAANNHCSFLGLGFHPGRLLPVVLVNHKHALTIPAHEPIPAINTNRVHYHTRLITAFRYGKELIGEDGKGRYGIGMYYKESGSWRCDSILFDETAHEPLLVKGRDAAQKIAEDEAQLRDESSASANQKTIIDSGLIEAPVLNAILGALLRTNTDAPPITIGIRSGRVQLLLEDDEGDSRALLVPKEGFDSHDEAAGMILQEIAYAVDNAARAQRGTSTNRPSKADAVFALG